MTAQTSQEGQATTFTHREWCVLQQTRITAPHGRHGPNTGGSELL